MFVVKVYFKNGTWALTLTQPVPEAFEFPASDWRRAFLGHRGKTLYKCVVLLLVKKEFAECWDM